MNLITAHDSGIALEGIWEIATDLGGVGHVCQNSNFRQNFPFGLHVIIQIQIKKFKNAFYLKLKLFYVKNYFNLKSVGVQP